ncbi:MAG: acylneuraminate cytidylyltransferase family protein [Candidatus Yanofskybacteria bacterium]|nr:acylneuraminate cytidylyltransferase family protein [Candidatus Yanofskybacteria bacterium]
MYNNRRVLGLITARGGSKSIPKKNIKEVAGKPLIVYTIQAAQESRLLTRTIVSTDDAEIIDVVKKFGAEVPFVRPAEYAQDSSPHIDVVLHALDWFKEQQGEEYDYVMILQPTSPLRMAEDIDNAIRKAVDMDADSVMSMMELVDFDPRKLKVLHESDEHLILPFMEEEGKTSAFRQHARMKLYKRNCAIYLTKTAVLRQRDLFGKTSRAYIMPTERSLDINEPFDLELAEYLLSRRGTGN